MEFEVGRIDNWPVIYIPEKDTVFCKNTAVKYNIIKRAIESSMVREVIEDKNLTITKNCESLHLGCLCTTQSNYKTILRNIKQIKQNG